VGMVFQDFQLLTDRDVYHNLRFVLESTGCKYVKAIDERIDEVLKTVGMLTKSYKMPHELSGGEQQRIVIARALLNRPAIILADEPTGNLDPDTGKRIVGVLHEIARGGTAVVMATHNIGFLSQFPATAYRCGEKHLTPFATEAAES
ncbi:MAG: ATP-binding cassette domain-containing protein, partial [Paramuribaculum sp.]|nr:ATP-binding cassette domain-containing protein [Paramuribaculum sp.]